MAEEEEMIDASVIFGHPAADSQEAEGNPQVAEASQLIRKLVNSRPNPSGADLHRLARIIEEEEAKYQEGAGYPTTITSRSYHPIGDILGAIRSDDEFYDMLCSDLFRGHPVSVRAGGFRIFLACMSCWGFTFNFNETVLQSVMELVTAELQNMTVEKDIHNEILHTCAIGLLACALSGNGETAEIALSSGQPAKFMRYLRHLTLGDCSKLDNGHGAVKEGRLKQDAEEDDDGEEVRRKREARVKKEEEKAGVNVRGKGKLSESLNDSEKTSRKDRSRPKVEDIIIQPTEDIHMAGNIDISVSVRKAVVAAETEARRECAPDEAVTIAKDAAAEMVKSAALEEFAKSEDEAAVLKAAETAAQAVEDASIFKPARDADAEATEREMVSVVSEEVVVDENYPDRETLAYLKVRHCVQCLERLGEYIDILVPVLQQRGVEVCFALLSRHYEATESVRDMAVVSDVLRLVSALSSHRKFAIMFVDLGGVPLLLKTPRVPQTTLAISSCLFGIATLQSAMERVCMLTPPVIPDLVMLAFELLTSTQDLTRKNAALSLGSALIYRPVVESFETHDGIGRSIDVFATLISVRNGTQSPNPTGELTSSDKQVAFQVSHTLRQFFRASFLTLVDSLRPVKSHRGGSRSTNNTRAPYKPMDLSTEAVDAVIQQLSRDRKLAATLMKTKWPTLDFFIAIYGHITLLELCQFGPHEKSLHEIAVCALQILQLLTLFPSTRKNVSAITTMNGRPGMGVLVDAASGAACADPEVIQAALVVLVNLVCPPPAISSRSSSSGVTAAAGSESTPVSETRISLGPCGGGPGMAAYIEQAYRFARETLRANNGIKVLLHLLYPRIVLPPSSVDCIRALACRVLLGLAKDPAIAQILTKLQVGKFLSELVRDGSQVTRQGGAEQDKWQNELSHLALDLMGVVTNAGRAGTVTSDAAAPTLRRIERAAIAAATPISYHSRELLQLVHEHLMASGLTHTASTLLKEAQITPLDALVPVSSLSHACSDSSADKRAERQWPSGRVAGGPFMSGKDDKLGVESSAKKKFLRSVTPKKSISVETSQDSVTRPMVMDEKTPAKSLKRKANEAALLSPNNNKRLHVGVSPLVSPVPKLKPTDTPASLETGTQTEAVEKIEDAAEIPSQSLATPSSHLVERKDPPNERATLDGLVGQYLKHQHRQCPAPITTLPPLSLLQPHVCPESSHTLYAPSNITSRIAAREKFPPYGGLSGKRLDIHFVYSRFRHLRVSRDEDPITMTCATFAGRTGTLAAGCVDGSIRLFDSSTGNFIENQHGHTSEVTSIVSAPDAVAGDYGSQLLLSSASTDTRLWNSTALNDGAVHVFSSTKSALFNHSGSRFGALKPDSPKEVLLYDVNTCERISTLTDPLLSQSNFRAQPGSLVHFSPSDILVLWNGVMWDHRVPRALHRFDQFSDYGGGGFHPGGNEVIINSEVWDLRTFKLLRSVSSLDQTVIKFNTTGDVIYATLRNTGAVESALQSKRAKHPLYSAFRTMDAFDYNDIATTQVDRCVLDVATHYNDSLIAVLVMEPNDSYVKFYEAGRRRPTDDDSDPDDGLDTDEDDGSDGEEETVVQILTTRTSTDSSSDSDDSTSDDEGGQNRFLNFLTDSDAQTDEEMDSDSDSDF